MSSIKIELDIPEFEKELSINVILTKDGEVYYKNTEEPIKGNTKIDEKPSSTPKKEKKVAASAAATNSSFGGNMMNLDI